MHSDSQISFHAIAPLLKFSHGGRIHRSCTASVYLLRDEWQDEHAHRRKTGITCNNRSNPNIYATAI